MATLEEDVDATAVESSSVVLPYLGEDLEESRAVVSEGMVYVEEEGKSRLFLDIRERRYPTHITVHHLTSRLSSHEAGGCLLLVVVAYFEVERR